MAVRRACAAARADAAHRRAPVPSPGRCGNQTYVGAFLQALALLGWTIGRNVRIDIRWATANADGIRRHAADNSKVIGQLIGLERRARKGGRDLIDHAPGGHDDLANAVAGAVLSADKAAPANFNRRLEHPTAKSMGFV